MVCCRYVLLACLTLTACTTKTGDRRVTRAIYHWQSTFDLSVEEKTYLDSARIDKLYLRFFDVDHQGGNTQPLAELRLPANLPQSMEIVPAVFITNRTFSEGTFAPDTLAVRVARKLQRQLAALPGSPPVHEVQLDCDWTASTRHAYFRFLRAFRKAFGDADLTLSATIRLHQVRYPEQTGIPPVDRGMLMYYNVGKVTQWIESNSILDPAAALPYHAGIPAYPLPLDLALPAFRWGVLFREGRMIRLINDLAPTDLADTSRFEPLGKNRYRCRRSTYLRGYYLYREDRLRLEAADYPLLKKAAAPLEDYLKPGNLSVAIYHLHPSLPNLVSYAQLDSLYRTVGR